MDEKTLKKLLKEAKKNLKSSTKAFEKWDNYDDMNDMNHWRSTVDWLQGKLDEIGALNSPAKST